MLDDPEEVERRELHAALSRVESVNGYEFEEGPVADVPDDAQQRVDALRALMDRVCALSPLDLGLARHVLRRCRRYEIRAILPQLLERLDHFVPVMNDVVLYLRAVANRGMVERNHAAILRAIASPAVLDVEWARYWAAHLVVRTWPLLNRPEFDRYVSDYGGLENQAFAAFQKRNVAWIRQQRARIDEMGGWARRRVLHAGLALAADERRHWYRILLANNRPGVERWVIPWLIAQT